MAPMKQQPITDDSFTEAEAMNIVRGLSEAGGVRPAQAHAVLARTVEAEVIPRLLAARRAPKPACAAAAEADLAPLHVAELVRLVLKGTQAQATAYVGSLAATGHGADYLLLDLLTRAARSLGEMWEQDICDFTEVTMGVLRLHALVRLICAECDAGLQPGPQAPRALLVQAPGEKHGLGLAMVVHFFRRAGWHVHSEPVGTAADLASLAAADRFGLAGISVSCSDHMEQLAASITALRRASRNPAIRVLVGGPAFIRHPQLAGMVGADGTASDAQLAVQQAEKLVLHAARNQ